MIVIQNDKRNPSERLYTQPNTTQTARCGTLKASSCTAGTKLHETLEAVMRAPPCICLCRQPQPI